MKFTAIFLTGAALAQHAVVFSIAGPPQPVNPVPGECTPLMGIPVINAVSSPDIGLKFYTGYECDGEQVATSTEHRLNPMRILDGVHSVKTVSREELANEDPSYYIYWGRY